MDGQTGTITVELVAMPDDNREPCDFCSTPEHAVVMERGIVSADYRVENTYGVTVGHACDTCSETIVSEANE